MKLLRSSNQPTVLQRMRAALETAGLEHQMRNEMLGGAVGEIPATETIPEIWVHDADVSQALEIIGQIKNADTGGPAWTCVCGEVHESQFRSCWNCGAGPPD